MTHRKLIEQMLDALITASALLDMRGTAYDDVDEAITAAREHLAAPEQSEPVAYYNPSRTLCFSMEPHEGYAPVYLHPAPPLRELPAYHMTSEQVVIIAKTICSLHSLACGVDTEDCWNIYSEDFLTDARVIVDELNNAAERKAL